MRKLRENRHNRVYRKGPTLAPPSLMGRGMALRPDDFTDAFCSHISGKKLEEEYVPKWKAAYVDL